MAALEEYMINAGDMAHLTFTGFLERKLECRK
jgi:hypothetical protein